MKPTCKAGFPAMNGLLASTLLAMLGSAAKACIMDCMYGACIMFCINCGLPII